MKKLKELPKFKNEDEERDFWSTHSFLDYYDIKKFKRMPPPVASKDVVLHQMLAGMTEQVERLSREKKMSVEEMVRQLVAAGLKQQGLQPGA
jgi:CopG antitoxin of type II toxin-antitoxin system